MLLQLARVFPAARRLTSIFSKMTNNKWWDKCQSIFLTKSSWKGADNYHSLLDGGLSVPLMWQIRELATKLEDRNV